MGKRVHTQIRLEFPDEVLEDYNRLSAWITELALRYQDRLLIRIIDVQSGLGFWKSLRHWARRYPTFILNGRKCYTGWDKKALEEILARELEGDENHQD